MTLKIIIIYLILYLVCAIVDYAILHTYYNNKKFCESEEPNGYDVFYMLCPVINMAYLIVMIGILIPSVLNGKFNTIDYKKFFRVKNIYERNVK